MPFRSFRSVAVCVLAICVAVALSNDRQPSFALTNGGSMAALDAPLTENFDTLAQTGTNIAWTDSVTIPGWYSSRTSYNSGTGSSNTGALYSFGVAGTNAVTDRALGSVGSGGTGTVYWAVRLTNNTGATISSLDVSYIGEQWRTGGSSNATPSVAQTVDFQYQVANAGVITGANTPASGWLDQDALDFTSPAFGTTAGAALDGNAAANRTAKARTLSVTLAPGQEIWLRWRDIDHANNDHGLAIDDLSVTPHGQPESAPTVTGTTPANGATGIGLNSAIVINFSESVNATASAFDVQCPTGSFVTVAQSASPAGAFTLTPTAPLPSATSCTVTVHAAQVTDADANDPPDQMEADFSFSFTTANPPPPGAANVVINEVDADTPGADTAEFVELYDGGAGNTPLDGLAVVFYNGDGDQVYAAFDLDGYTTNANGYFTLGNPGVQGVDLVFDPGQFGLLQNGADAVALYVGNASDFPIGAPVTTANLQDAVVYDTDDADDPGLLALLNADQPQVNENGGGSGTTQSSQRCPNGSGGFRNTSTYQQGTPTPGAANSCIAPPPPNNSAVVISQIYGGGGNTSATYQNDYVELYNKSTSPADLTGWTLQYTSASGNSWDFTRQPLGGTIGPGEYYLIALASNGAVGLPLPAANVVGQINMSASNGKVALVDTFEALVGNCPTFNPHVMDLVGYGSADCREGSTTAPSPGNNTTALFRQGNGSVDTNDNGNDFFKGAPNPRRTAPIVELGPQVLSTDPRANGVNAPRDATIFVSFTEPVDVVDPWFTLTCASSGAHTSATFAVNGAGRDHYITPNDNFTPGESCTVTIFKDQIHDVDTDDSGPNTDSLPANYVWSFTVSTGTAPPFPSSVHLTMGNPSGATTSDPNNYLMEKPEFTLSYNRDKGRPNWVSWHLSTEWVGTLTRVDTFRPDPEVPAEWYRVQSFDFSGSGFDRGHMTPNADRDKETSIPINQATFLMSNMVAQSPDNNQGPWASLENYLRTLVEAGNELYIVSGPVGIGGTGSNGGVTTTLAGGHVTVPNATWKAALVIQAGGGDDVSRVNCSTRTIAVIMPNIQGIRNDPWENYLTTVDAVEALTGYDLFSTLPSFVQSCVEAGINGNNSKNEQTITFDPIDPHTFGDADFALSASASSGLQVTLAVLSGPATIAGSTVHITGPGTVTIRASQPGDVNFKAAPDVDRSFDVAKATPLFSSLSSPAIEAGTPATIVSGAIGVNGLVPAGNVTITLGAATQTAPIGPGGGFSASLATATLSPAGSPYAIGFVFAGDAAFNAAGAASTLAVADTIPPVLTLNGASPMTVELGTAFVDPGASATDSFAGNLTAAIQVSGAVNTAVVGSYTRTYTVSDGYNTVSATRTVDVLDHAGPVISGLKATPNTLFFPTNTLWPVIVSYTASDAGGSAACSLSVTSNDDDLIDHGKNKGKPDPDIDFIVVGPHLVLLRAEKEPKKDPALVYTITVTCTDPSNNASTAQVGVSVRKRK